jgi:hypothetical protein
MNRKLLRSFLGRAASVALLMVLAYQAPAVIAWAQDAAGKAPAVQPAPKQDSPDTTEEPAPYTITSNVRLVTTPVTVFDTSGNFVYDLEKDEFKIYDNGELQDVKQFDSEMRRRRW